MLIVHSELKGIIRVKADVCDTQWDVETDSETQEIGVPEHFIIVRAVSDYRCD
jgi:hypothetical protein